MGALKALYWKVCWRGWPNTTAKNLAREVEKGNWENASRGRHVGGVPPLGYDLDRTIMMLVIDERKAEAVRLIFSQYLKGASYGHILAQLNTGGYKKQKNGVIPLFSMKAKTFSN